MAYTLGNTYTMAAFSSTNQTKTITVTYAAAKVARIAITVPAGKQITAYSTVSGTQTDTYGYLCSGATSSFSGRNPSGVTILTQNDDSNGSSQWRFTYANSGSSAVTWYIYHMGYSESTAGATNVITVTTSDAWLLGNTYTMPTLSTTGATKTSVSVSCAANRVARITVTVPAHSRTKFYCTTTNNVDTYGYCTQSAYAIVATSGAPNGTILSQNNDGNGNRQWLITITHSGDSATTLYIYHRAYAQGTACSSVIYAECSVGTAWTYRLIGSGGSITANVTQSVTLTTSSTSVAANEVAVFYYQVPPYTTVTLYPTTTSNVDTVGFYMTGYYSVSAQGLPNTYAAMDDNTHGSSQWQLTYTNPSTVLSQTIYVYTRAKNTNTATTQILNAQVTSTMPNWTLGNTYNYTVSGASGSNTYISGLSVAANRVIRIALTIPAYSTVKVTSALFSSDSGVGDTYRPYVVGYISRTADSVDTSTGAPTNVASTNNYSGPGNSTQLVWNNNTNAAVTRYFYMRDYFHGRTDTGGYQVEVWTYGGTIPQGLGGSHMQVYNGSAWVAAIPQVYNGSSWVSAQDTLYNGSSWS